MSHKRHDVPVYSPESAPERGCYSKYRYPTAKDAARVRHRREAEGSPPLYVYGCTGCGGYHLTRKRPETSNG